MSHNQQEKIQKMQNSSNEIDNNCNSNSQQNQQTTIEQERVSSIN